MMKLGFDGKCGGLSIYRILQDYRRGHWLKINQSIRHSACEDRGVRGIPSIIKQVFISFTAGFAK
jgi:hypothetical protein